MGCDLIAPGYYNMTELIIVSNQSTHMYYAEILVINHMGYISQEKTQSIYSLHHAILLRINTRYVHCGNLKGML